MDSSPPVRGLIGWFSSNHVAANLLMFFIIGAGLYSVMTVKKESFPSFQFDQVDVRVFYPGAGPEEVEEGIVVKIEEAVESIEGIQKVTGVASEGMGQVSVEVTQGFDLGDITDEVKLAVDGISTFPDEAERPVISKRKFNRGALNVQVHGQLDEIAMKGLAEQIRDEIVALPNVSSAVVWGARPFEVAVEISEITLREYGLTLEQVSQAIQRWSLNLPGGVIRSEAGNIRLRVQGQAYTGADFENIVLLSQKDGTIVRLGDVANIVDGFAEVESYAFFDGAPSFGISVMSTENENEIVISEAVHEYVNARNQTLPEEVKLTAWGDSSYYLKGRMNMMLSNMAMGAVLVFIILSLFLHLKIAAWVIIGLPVAFLGAFMMLPLVDVTINIMSLFAFILVLGIVVDDAIIVAESAYSETEAHGYTLPNIVVGVQRVAVPATFGVLTTIMAFLPMLFVTGPTSSLNGALGWVVVFCLLFSLIESKLILPSHLALMRSSHGDKKGVSDWVDVRLRKFVREVYQPFLEKAIEYRYTTLAFFVALMILTAGVLGGGYVRFVFFPEIESDFVMANVELQDGVPEALVKDIIEQMDASLRQINEEVKQESGIDEDVVKHMFAYITDGTQGRFQVELSKNENRAASPKQIEQRWRELVGEVAGTKDMSFSSSSQMGGGPPIAFKLQGNDVAMLEQAASELAAYLRTYSGLYEVRSSADAGPQEIRLRVKPQAEAQGVTLVDLARQVRQAFYGVEVQRIQRGSDEVKVMVRYPKDERLSIGNLEGMWIRLADGRALPFDAVADYEMSPGYSAINRSDGLRTVTVTANADTSQVEPSQVMQRVTTEFKDKLLSRYSGLKFGLDGSSLEESSSLKQIGYAFIAALFGIYALMAIPLKSYAQPLIIMSVIPFGIIGAVFGHWLLGIALNSISLIGIIALSGVVVNDSLIMVDFVNKRLAEGGSVARAAIESGGARFRAILLTSLTTFFGLIPILAESSVQAQVVIPMAVSLAFGILFATVITLVLVPCLYNILQDFRGERESAIDPGAVTQAR